MLRGIVGQKEISKERLEAKKEQIQEQALKRFTENASKRDSDLEKNGCKKQYSEIKTKAA